MKKCVNIAIFSLLTTCLVHLYYILELSYLDSRERLFYLTTFHLLKFHLTSDKDWHSLACVWMNFRGVGIGCFQLDNQL